MQYPNGGILMKDNLRNSKTGKRLNIKRWSKKSISMLLAIVMVFTSMPILTSTLANAITSLADVGVNSVSDPPIFNDLNEGDRVDDNAKSSAFTGNCVWTDADRTNTAGETGALVKMYKKAENSYYFYLRQT